MITLKTFDYEKFKVQLFFNPETNLFTASAAHLITKEIATADQCEAQIKIDINAFISQAPKDIDELAGYIGSTLVWTGYEDCYVDPLVLKTLLQGYLRTQGINTDLK